MDNMDREEHLPEQEVQRTHTATCLIYTPSQYELLNRKVNCVNKISGYKYIQIFQFIQRANKWKIH
jgi:hypothetical protein